MSPSNSAADSFLTGGGVRSAFVKDDPVGTTVSGVIAEDPEVRQQTDIATGVGLTWDSGDPKMQLLVTVRTADLDSPDDDGMRRFYVKGSTKAGSRSLHDAVATAVRAAGAKGLEVGGTLAVTLEGSEASKTRGYSDRKLYSATYAKPDKSAATAGFLGTNGAESAASSAPAAAPSTSASTATAAPATSTPAGGIDPKDIETARNLIAAGLDDALIFQSAPSITAPILAGLRSAGASAGTPPF